MTTPQTFSLARSLSICRATSPWVHLRVNGVAGMTWRLVSGIVANLATCQRPTKRVIWERLQPLVRRKLGVRVAFKNASNWAMLLSLASSMLITILG